MSEEYLDIVDDSNHLTGEQKSRAEVHTSGLRHRVVHIYYFIQKGGKYYFLVHLRSKDKDLSPNKWDTRFGGHLKAGETVEDALVSEFNEEIGLKLNCKNFIKGLVCTKNHYPNNEFAYIYYCEGQEDCSNLTFKDHEVQKVKWMLASDIIKEKETNPENWTSGLEVFEMIYDDLIKNRW